MKKQGQMPSYFGSNINRSRKNNIKKLYYRPISIEVDVIQKKESCTNQKLKGNCYNCSKPDHMIR